MKSIRTPQLLCWKVLTSFLLCLKPDAITGIISCQSVFPFLAQEKKALCQCAGPIDYFDPCMLSSGEDCQFITPHTYLAISCH